MSYDPAVHRRKSIRLKGHDYTGGGMLERLLNEVAKAG